MAGSLVGGGVGALGAGLGDRVPLFALVGEAALGVGAGRVGLGVEAVGGQGVRDPRVRHGAEDEGADPDRAPGPGQEGGEGALGDVAAAAGQRDEADVRQGGAQRGTGRADLQVVGEGGVEQPHRPGVPGGAARDVQADDGVGVREPALGVELLVPRGQLLRGQRAGLGAGVVRVQVGQGQVVVQQRGVDPVRAAQVQHHRTSRYAVGQGGAFGRGTAEDRLRVVRDLVPERGEPGDVRPRVGLVVDVVEARLADRSLSRSVRVGAGHGVTPSARHPVCFASAGPALPVFPSPARPSPRRATPEPWPPVRRSAGRGGRTGRPAPPRSR